MTFVHIALALIELHAPDGHRVSVNPAEIISIREPRASDVRLLSKHVKCIVTLTNGHFVSVAETCDQVTAKLR